MKVDKIIYYIVMTNNLYLVMIYNLLFITHGVIITHAAELTPPSPIGLIIKVIIV